MTDWGKPISRTGSLAGSLGRDQPFRYRGYVYDEETGWYYLQSRYYDPETCRFISADVLLSTGQGVIGHNSFAYCNNNPILLADSDGTVPYQAFFHDLVIADIVAKYPEAIMCTEFTVDHNRFGKGRIGWVDLVDIWGGYYEVKPYTQCLSAPKQLSHYLESAPYYEPAESIYGSYPGSLEFEGEFNSCVGGVYYKVTYVTVDSIVIYDVDVLSENAPVEVFVPAPDWKLAIRYKHKKKASMGSVPAAAPAFVAFASLGVCVLYCGARMLKQPYESLVH